MIWSSDGYFVRFAFTPCNSSEFICMTRSRPSVSCCFSVI
ncbi:Uncharacterised protein [Vibrio cholerae]|nr:Uncharacterised protein [Vibrio cholerae]